VYKILSNTSRELQQILANRQFPVIQRLFLYVVLSKQINESLMNYIMLCMEHTKIGTCQFLIISSPKKPNSKRDKAFSIHLYIMVRE